MKIYAGSSNAQLVKKLLGESLDEGQIELSKFANHESRVLIKDVPTNTSAVVQSFSSPVDHHIIEFCLIADALKRSGASEITAVIPWLGYSKQDKVFRQGEPLSVKVIANLIQATSLKKVITLDLHNPAIIGFFDIPVINIRAMPLFTEYYSALKATQNYCVISPDAGAVKMATEFANSINVPIAYVNKKRDLQTGLVSIVDIDKDITGVNALIIDDLIASGSTMLSIAGYLKEKGAASVSIAATHHLYLQGVQDAIDSSVIDEVVVTDSIQKPESVTSSKLKVITANQLIAPFLV